MNKQIKKQQRKTCRPPSLDSISPDLEPLLYLNFSNFRIQSIIYITTHQKQCKPDLCGMVKALIEVSKVIKQETRKCCYLLKKQDTDLLKNKNIGIISFVFFKLHKTLSKHALSCDGHHKSSDAFHKQSWPLSLVVFPFIVLSISIPKFTVLSIHCSFNSSFIEHNTSLHVVEFDLAT